MPVEAIAVMDVDQSRLRKWADPGIRDIKATAKGGASLRMVREAGGFGRGESNR
jgi:hypothetical protein